MLYSQQLAYVTESAGKLLFSRSGYYPSMSSSECRRLGGRSMKKIEWIREALSVWPSPDYLNQREAAGWRIVAVEWEREMQAEPAAPTDLAQGEEIPYGTRIAQDCLHLEE